MEKEYNKKELKRKEYWFENNPFTTDPKEYREMLSNVDFAAKMLKDHKGIFILNAWNGRDCISLSLSVIQNGVVDSRDLVKTYKECLSAVVKSKDKLDELMDFFNIRNQDRFWKWVDERYGKKATWLGFYEPGIKI